MKGADLFVKCLEAAGIEYIFGLPGEENLAFLDAVRRSKIEFITTRDEQTAVFMAATLGRLTGRVGVAMSTLGPGATNLVTGVAYAQLGGMPLLVITGQKPIRKSKQGKFQIIDVVGMMRPITKMAEQIVSADRIPAAVIQAVRIAEAERPGAVHLEFPEDIAEEYSDEKPIPWKKVRRPVPDDKSIIAVIAEIEKARSPLIAIAAGANRKLIRKQLRNFIAKTKIPFVTTQMGKGVEDEGTAEYIGTTALSGGDHVHKATAKADLILLIGHDITEKPPVLPRVGQKIVHLNFYPADIDHVYKPYLEVVGDISHALWVMSKDIKVQKRWDFKKFHKIKDELRAHIGKKTGSDRFPIVPQRFVHDLRQVLPRDAILSLDNGMYKLWISRNYPAYEQNTVLLDNAFATMGAGLAVGMAAKLINPRKKVVVVAGDGGFLMNVADLETAKRLKLDLVIIILDDSGYGMIKWKQSGMGLKDFGLSFENPDFVQLAAAFGVTGHCIESAAEFEPTLRNALKDGGIHIIALPIDYTENARAFGGKAEDDE
ncbi:acetolactate synthase large subunit [Candidatus Parcubacteria bacterium]|nr:MAG: acetolactate synthase large subunit [Candidatus Parcubacteria bacterium]